MANFDFPGFDETGTNNDPFSMSGGSNNDAFGTSDVFNTGSQDSSQGSIWGQFGNHPNQSGGPDGGGGGGLFGNANIWGGKNQTGAIPGALQVGGNLANIWLGMKQLDLAEESFAFQKNAFNKNFESQAKLTNANLRSRQVTRNLDNPHSMNVDDFMSKYGINT